MEIQHHYFSGITIYDVILLRRDENIVAQSIGLGLRLMLVGSTVLALVLCVLCSVLLLLCRVCCEVYWSVV